MKRNKKLYKIIFITLTPLIFNLYSCKSNKIIPIPGEDQIIIDNIYMEYSNIGDNYFKLEDYTNAAKYYKMAMQNRKLYWNCYYKLGKCYVYNSDWSNALTVFEKLLKRDKNNDSLKASLAYIYSMNNKVDNAIEIYEELFEKEPDNVNYLENYIALILSSEKTYKKYAEVQEELMNKLLTDYPENKNIESFNKSIEKYNPQPKTEDSEESTEEKTEETD